VSVSVYDDDDDDTNADSPSSSSSPPRRLLCSTLFELGHVLGSPGGTVGKECSVGVGGSGAAAGGTILVLQVEPSHADLGMFHFHLGSSASSTPHPLASTYFELQRLRQSVRTGSRVWDCVFRSRSKEPIGGGGGGGRAAAQERTWWDESFVELDELCGGDLHETFRIAVYESLDSNSSASATPALWGECRCSIQDLTAKALTAGERTSSALAKVGTDRAFELRREGGTAAGYLWVPLAEVLLDGSAPTKVEIPEAERRQRQIDFAAANEGEIYVASSSEELVVEPYGSVGRVEPTFVNFIRGGCQLHVVAAVDATASNGDPRKDGTLHCFNPTNGQPNAYERALEALCTLLSRYDSDQRYPVYGFGARPKGGAVVSHCFPLHPGRPVVDGVRGILQAYRDAFRSGIVMSSPRDYSAVIETSAAQARSEMVRTSNFC
jgi:Copine